jgi:CubicO group peptidase (beta-lactamase class C family)
MVNGKKGRTASRRLLLACAVGAATTGCTDSYSGRWVVWNWSGVDDHLKFPARPVEPAPAPFRFATAEGPAPRVEVKRRGRTRALTLDELGRTTSTTALIVARRDTIVFEGYFNGHDRASISTSFSIAKSITSLLVGTALDRGHIGSVHDPVTDYLPELAERDPRFTRLTVAHLLDMRSGLRWRDHEFITGDKARAYYHPHLRRLVLGWLPFTGEPGEVWEYNSFNPIVLGLVLERSTGGSAAAWLAESLWRRIGTEHPASWSVDGERDPMEKMESGVNARAIDFLKVGRLVLLGGAWDGERVVSREWLEDSTRLEGGCEIEAYAPRRVCYRRGWWLYPAGGDEPRAVAATGHLGQYLFVFPDQEVVIARFGRKPGGVHWPTVFRAIVRALEADDVA